MHALKCSPLFYWRTKKVFKKAWILLVKETRLVFVFLSVSPQVALHACGVATDMVMEHCIQAGAAFVISPCCYGFIQNAIKFTFPKRFAPAHLGPMSPLRGSAFLNVVSDLVFLLDTSEHRCSSSLTFSYYIFWIRIFFFSVSLLGLSLSHSLSLSLTHTYTQSVSLVNVLFVFFTACLLSSPLTVWGSSVTSPSQQGPPLPSQSLCNREQGSLCEGCLGY